jgi:hypothetical protein
MNPSSVESVDTQAAGIDCCQTDSRLEFTPPVNQLRVLIAGIPKVTSLVADQHGGEVEFSTESRPPRRCHQRLK